jgi:hypothetical protein
VTVTGNITRPLVIPAVIGVMLAAAIGPGTLRAQEGMPPADVRAVIEGTWELTEWHVGDVVVRPPEIEGRWMVHDGHVMANAIDMALFPVGWQGNRRRTVNHRRLGSVVVRQTEHQR